MRPISIIIVFTVFIFSTCTENRPNKVNINKINNEKEERRYKLINPQSGTVSKIGDDLRIELKPVKADAKFDSCLISVDGKSPDKFAGSEYVLNTANLNPGTRRIAIKIFASDSLSETINFSFKLLPGEAPKLYGYKIVNEYPHDNKAYTQGLFYHDGFLYEGTGQHGYSSIRKVDLQTGEVIKKHTLENEYFGEGICLYNNRILQLTWTDRKGFVYGLDDFELQGRFRYNTEGWGITSDDRNLWMSDGTSTIYKIDLGNVTTSEKTISIIELTEVYTNEGNVKGLNELEFIEGEIWANVYTENNIVRIDPDTGIVTGIVDLEGILDKKLIAKDTDVLNGIAYDKENKRIFVTGKNWPRLFEIKLIEK